MNKNIHFGKKWYLYRTPATIKKLADSILIVLSSSAVVTLIKDYPHIGVYFMLAGVIAKIGSQFFSDE